MADNIFDNNAGTLRTIAATSGVLTYSNTATDTSFSLDPTDTNDYYKLTVSRSSNVIIKLNSLSSPGGDLKLALLDYTGDPNNTIVSGTNNPNSLAEAIVTDSASPLQPGQTYYIRVSADNPTTTINYSLSVETLPTSRADLLWRYYGPANAGGGTNSIWKMNGTQFVEAQPVPYVDPSWVLAAAGDLNGDGNEDYLWRQPSLGIVALWLMGADGNQVQSSLILSSGIGEGWNVAGIADFNGDQKPDILWQYYPTGLSAVWIMDGPTVVSGETIQSLQDPGWSMEMVADFDKDGKADVLYRNFSTGENQIWLMDGLKFKAAAALPSKASNWYIKGAGDFNGDGNTDVIVRDNTTGQVDVWFLQGTTYLSSTTITTIDPAWVIADVLETTPTVDLAKNTRETGFNIGKLDATATYTDAIGGKDANDYYVFTLDSKSKVNIALTGAGIAATTDVLIETADGTLITGGSSTANGTDEEKITDLQLNAGTYYVRVKSTSTTSINYAISIGASPKLPSNLKFVGASPVTIKNVNTGNTIPSTTAISVYNSAPIRVDYSVTDVGGPLDSFKVAFYLSKDGTLDANDYRFDLNNDGQQNASDVATITNFQPDTTLNLTQNLTLPSKNSPFWTSNGAYNIIVVLDPDNEILEEEPEGVPKETDNTSLAGITVKNARTPDLAPQTFNVVQDQAAKNTAINLTGFIKNIGGARSDDGVSPNSPFEVRFYLSTNSLEEPAVDYELASIEVNPLDPGAEVSLATLLSSVLLPSTWSGYQQSQNNTYYVLMSIDPDRTLKEVSVADGGASNLAFDTIVIP